VWHLERERKNPKICSNFDFVALRGVFVGNERCAIAREKKNREIGFGLSAVMRVFSTETS